MTQPGQTHELNHQQKKLRVNVGCGNEPMEGFINVDTRLCRGVQLIADVRQLPFCPGSVDTLVASSLLEHFSDPYEVLTEIHRVLAPTGKVLIRVPSPWSFLAHLDPTHRFVADLRLWRQILSNYFETVKVYPEGVRYRDNKLLCLLMHVLVRLFRFYEFAQCWRFECSGKKPNPSPAYIPWWLEEKYAGRSEA